LTALEASWDALDSFDGLESTRSTQVYPRYKRPFPDVGRLNLDPNQILEASDGSDDDDDIINMLPLAQGGPGMLKITWDM